MTHFIVKRQLYILSETHLRLDTKETQGYMNLLGGNISLEDADELRAICGGWPLALNSVYMEIEQNNGNIVAGNQYLRSRKMLYITLEKEILDPLDKRHQRFLLLLSFYQDFSMEKAKILTGEDESELLLEDLFKIGNFINETTDNRLRFQDMIYEFLNIYRERKLTEAELDGACKRIGSYFEKKEMLLKALEAYFWRNLYEDGMRVLKKMIKKQPANIEYYKIEPYLLKLPREMAEKEPLLCNGMAIIHTINYRVDEALNWYRLLINMRETLPPDIQKKEALEMIIVHANIGIPFACNDRQLMREIWNAAKIIISLGFSFPELTVTGNQPRIMAGSRDFSSWCNHAFLLKRVLSKPLEIVLGFRAGGIIYTGLAEMYYQRDALNNSMIEVSKAIAKNGRAENTLDILFTDKVIIAQILQARGQMDEARQLLEKFKEQLAENHAHELLSSLKAFEALQNLMEGNNELALEWSVSEAPDETKGFRVLERYGYLMKIRVYLCTGATSRALPLIEVFQNYVVDYSRHYNLIETTILKAICLDKMGEVKLADETMIKAIALAESFNFVRIFADEGGGSYLILERLKEDERVKDSGYYKRILKAAEIFYKRYPQYYQKKKEKNQTLLTAAEKTVLQEIATGKTNPEIAEQLYVSLATVKTHINRIYGKLAVRNCTQALLEARKQHLI